MERFGIARTYYNSNLREDHQISTASLIAMRTPALSLALILTLCVTIFAIPPSIPKLDALLERALEQSQGRISLPTPKTFNSTQSNQPWGIKCYDADSQRTPITYDTCSPLFYELSNSNDFRVPKRYASRNPISWKKTNSCQMTVWPGPVADMVANQYIAAMTIWYVPFELRFPHFW